MTFARPNSINELVTQLLNNYRYVSLTVCQLWIVGLQSVCIVSCSHTHTHTNILLMQMCLQKSSLNCHSWHIKRLTHSCVSPTPTFETPALDHSDVWPLWRLRLLRLSWDLNITYFNTSMFLTYCCYAFFDIVVLDYLSLVKSIGSKYFY